jgi:hypothetical protein
MNLNIKTTETTSQVFLNHKDIKEIAAFKRIVSLDSYALTTTGESYYQEGTERGSAKSGGTRMTNEYFIPKDGIDREVITADICRYLGNDALVRTGIYEVIST